MFVVCASTMPWIADWSPTLGHTPFLASAAASSTGHFAWSFAAHLASASVYFALLAVVARTASALSRQLPYLAASLFLAAWQSCAGVGAAGARLAVRAIVRATKNQGITGRVLIARRPPSLGQRGYRTARMWPASRFRRLP